MVVRMNVDDHQISLLDPFDGRPASGPTAILSITSARQKSVLGEGVPKIPANGRLRKAHRAQHTWKAGG
jgi:hypothetical protein